MQKMKGKGVSEGGRHNKLYINRSEVSAAEAMTNSQNWRRTPIRTRSTHNAHTEDVSVAPFPSFPCGMLRILSRQRHRSLFNVKSGRSLLLLLLLHVVRVVAGGSRGASVGKLLQMSTVFAVGKVDAHRSKGQLTMLPPSLPSSCASRPLMTFTRMQTHTHKSFAFVSSDSNKIQREKK